MPEIKEYADLAKSILTQDTNYQKDKNLISDIFDLSNLLEDKEHLRLTVIDSSYSTQMNKRFFGIDSLSKALRNISIVGGAIETLAIEYINNPECNNQISDLFNSEFGFKKTGKSYGKANSLITKYLYFLTKYKFPIYDSLVKKSYKYFKKKYPDLNLPKIPNVCNNAYFQAINILNAYSEINNYDILDNLLWLTGKIQNGSFSLIINNETYLQLVENINFDDSSNSRENDNLIRTYIKNANNRECLLRLFGKDIIKFIDYCLNNDAT